MTAPEDDSEKNYRPSDNSASIMAYALQATDTVIWDWNIPADDVSLYPPSQSVFDDITDLDDFLGHVHPADKQRVVHTLEVAVEQTGQYMTEFRLVGETETETQQWVAAQGEVDYDDVNDPVRLIGVGRDVTSIKQTNEQLRRATEHLAETELVSDIGGWELTPETNDLWWTQGTKQIHDVSPEYDPTVEGAFEFIHPEDRQTIEKTVQQCLTTGEPYSAEIRLITAEGRERWVYCKGDRIERGDTAVLRGIIQDITDRKIRDQRLMVLSRVLRHNIRNSLGVVIGNAELLQDELEALAPLETSLAETASFSLDDSRRMLSKVTTNATQLVELAEDARQLSRVLERGPVRYHVDVPAVMDRLVPKLADQYPNASIHVETQAVGVKGNDESLEMALTELIENAIIHSHQASPTVEVRTSKVDNGRVSIQVADTGPGIPEMEQEVLETGTEEPLLHGHGIGLWIVNWLMTQLGGSVSIEDRDPRGTVVELTLPAATRVESSG
ncbi:PAS domain-containing sensor histidine kinase [Haloferax gibbonsii]|uniref:histidine kinase n=1 Tax=Haloferax gibbonsii TaxID=35746 RepID=A0A0K1IUM4_HALGI|nr:PAS domain-containing sensor histidine kinase [Haloferax gibbonsii]AKU08166.1 histidine kinase [Haloferax gibbonsii]QOS12697.1 sensor box histidine kinase [Haloferax gibbonsii]